MSALAAVVATVAATPVPSPQVVKEVLQPVVQPVADTPAVVVQLAQIAGLAVAMFVVSVFHQVLEFVTTKSKQGGWNDNFNRALATLYSVAGGLVTAFSTGNLKPNFTGIATGVLSVAVALAATFWGYELRKFFIKLMGFVQVSPDASANLGLATDAPTDAPA